MAHDAEMTTTTAPVARGEQEPVMTTPPNAPSTASNSDRIQQTPAGSLSPSPAALRMQRYRERRRDNMCCATKQNAGHLRTDYGC
jgi:hypothetical protein